MNRFNCIFYLFLFYYKINATSDAPPAKISTLIFFLAKASNTFDSIPGLSIIHSPKTAIRPTSSNFNIF
ncbi:MAG: hypothetical protein ACP5TW_04760 [Thermoplasmata archaeon]